MKIIEPSVQLISEIDGAEMLKAIERAGRTCYKSEDLITEGSAIKFVRCLINDNHDAMLEHAPSISIKFICDRGVSHEIVRHRLFSFAQESTRYCNYSKIKFSRGLTFIKPCFWEEDSEPYYLWERSMRMAEIDYIDLVVKHQVPPEQARTVLPNSLKTELIVTGNVRAWRHFFKLRTAIDSHPQMRQVAFMALDLLSSKIDYLFDGLTPPKI